jgi:hypothetical protein
MLIEAPLNAPFMTLHEGRDATTGRSMAASFTKVRFRQFVFAGILGWSNLASAYSDGGGEPLYMLSFYAWSVHSLCVIYALTRWGGIWKAYAAVSVVANITLNAGTPLSGLIKLAYVLNYSLA